MNAFSRICIAVLYLGFALLFVAAMNKAAVAQAITFSPVEKPIILPANVQPFESIAVDNTGNIFFPNNNQITKVSASGVITTISSGLSLPDDVKTDEAGNVYIADNGTNQLVKITPGGVQSVVASGLNLGLDIQGLTFNFRDFVVDGSGNIFISDNPGSRVLKVTPSGTQTVLASGFAPENIALDSSGNVYVTDRTNNRIVEIEPSGDQTVLVSGLNTPGSIAVDDSRNIYVIHSKFQCCANNEVLKITPSGEKTTIFDGLSSTGQLAEGVAVDGTGNIYVGLALGGGGGTGIIELENTTSAFGDAIFGGNFASGQGFPLIQPVTFIFPDTVTLGSVQVLTNGAPSQDFQSASGGTCTAGTFTVGQTCTVNAQFVPLQAGARIGAVVLSDVNGNSVSTMYLNGIGLLPAAALNPGALENVLSSGLLDPSAVAVNGMGVTYIVDKGHSRVVKLTPSGVLTDLGNGLASPTGVAEDGAGNLYISDTANDRVVEITPNGDQTAILSGLNTPEGVAVDGADNLYVADAGNNRVLKLSQTPGKSIHVVQHADIDAATITSLSPAFASPNTAGNFIAVFVRAGQSGQVFTIRDSNGNAYHQAAQLNVSLDAPNGHTLAIFYAENIVAGANTVTVSDTISGTLRVAIVEYSGVALANSLDVTASAQGSGTSPSSGNTTTTEGGDLLLGAISTADAENFSTPNGVEIREFVPAEPNTKLIADDSVQTIPGSVSAGATLGASDPWGAILAAFKPAAGGPTQTTIGSGYSRPTGVTVDGVGNVFVADFGNNQIVKVTPDGAQTTVIGNLSSPSGVTTDARGNLYVAEVGSNSVIEVTPLSGGGTQTATILSGLNFPFDAVLVAVNGSGNVFVADTFNNRVLQVDRSQSNLNFGTVTIGQTVSQTITVSDVGLRPFNLDSISLDANDVNFKLTQSASPDCLAPGPGVGLPAPGSCNLTISFAPKTAGNFVGAVTITDAAGTQIVHLSGTAIAPPTISSMRKRPVPWIVSGIEGADN